MTERSSVRPFSSGQSLERRRDVSPPPGARERAASSLGDDACAIFFSLYNLLLTADLRGCAFQVVDLQHNALDGEETLEALSGLSQARVLYLQGNRLASLPSYRRRLVTCLADLSYLDDRPVDVRENRAEPKARRYSTQCFAAIKILQFKYLRGGASDCPTCGKFRSRRPPH